MAGRAKSPAVDRNNSVAQSSATNSAAGFNFTLHMRRLCADLVARVPELAHIDLKRVAIRFCQARKAVRHGVQASLTPLRFERGELYSQRRVEPGRSSASMTMPAAKCSIC